MFKEPIGKQMKTSDPEWKIVFNGTQIYHVKSKKTCIQIIVLSLLLLLVPVVVIVITYLAAPCFLLGHNGKLKNWIIFFSLNLFYFNRVKNIACKSKANLTYSRMAMCHIQPRGSNRR